MVIREKREAKGKDKNLYQQLKAKIQRKLRVDGGSWKAPHGITSSELKRKFQEALPDSQIND